MPWQCRSKYQQLVVCMAETAHDQGRIGKTQTARTMAPLGCQNTRPPPHASLMLRSKQQQDAGMCYENQRQFCSCKLPMHPGMGLMVQEYRCLPHHMVWKNAHWLSPEQVQLLAQAAVIPKCSLLIESMVGYQLKTSGSRRWAPRPCRASQLGQRELLMNTCAKCHCQTFSKPALLFAMQCHRCAAAWA